MARRMINPQAIIKSQIADDKYSVDLNEILEKYGTQDEWGITSITLQFYSKEAADDGGLIQISNDIDAKGYLIPNTAITITKTPAGAVYINGLILSTSDLNLLQWTGVVIDDGDYENGIISSSNYLFDVHVIKV